MSAPHPYIVINLSSPPHTLETGMLPNSGRFVVDAPVAEFASAREMHYWIAKTLADQFDIIIGHLTAPYSRADDQDTQDDDAPPF